MCQHVLPVQALKDKLRKYRLNNTALEALMLQKETRLLVIADTNARLRTQLLVRCHPCR